MGNSSLQPVLVLLADSAAGNPSQYMIEKAFEHHQLDWRYLSLEVAPEDLGDAVRGLRAMGFAGGNCAEQYRHAVVEHLDRLSQVAEMAGAANCFFREDRQLVGDNTEGKAFLESLRRHTDPAEKRVVLLGAGHVGRAIAVELALAGAAEIMVVNRTEQSGRELVDLLSDQLKVSASLAVWKDDYQLPAETDVLVNATSLGSEDPDAALPVNLDNLTTDKFVADVTVDPPDTWLIHEADERGATSIDGLEIFIDQAVINFKLWTGVDPDPAVMREAVEEFLEL